MGHPGIPVMALTLLCFKVCYENLRELKPHGFFFSCCVLIK